MVSKNEPSTYLRYDLSNRTDATGTLPTEVLGNGSIDSQSLITDRFPIPRNNEDLVVVGVLVQIVVELRREDIHFPATLKCKGTRNIPEAEVLDCVLHAEHFTPNFN
jgi:hypothetical protein